MTKTMPPTPRLRQLDFHHTTTAQAEITISPREPVTLAQKLQKVKQLVIDKAKVQKIKTLLKPSLIKEPLHPEAEECLQLIRENPHQTGMQMYKVGRLLGQGAYGKVNLGLHKITRKLVAIKSCKLQGI